MGNAILSLLALLAFTALAAAAIPGVPSQCVQSGLSCLSACCTNAGGTFDGQDCSSINPAYASQFYSCINNGCRPAIIQCAAPGSACPQQFNSCKATCSDQGCVDSCMNAAMSCAQQSSATTPPASCCGPALVFFPLLALVGLVAFKKQ